MNLQTEKTRLQAKMDKVATKLRNAEIKAAVADAVSGAAKATASEGAV